MHTCGRTTNRQRVRMTVGHIEGDKIKYFSPSPIRTPEQQEKLRAATTDSAGQAAPAALPRTGTDTRDDIWVGGFALLLIASGLGLIIRRRMHQM